MQPKTAKFKYQVEKIAGGAGENLACSVFSKNISVLDSNGLLVCLVVVSGHGDLPENARDVFELGASVLESTDLGVLPSLQRILESVDSYAAANSVEVSFLTGFFFKGACYLLKRGDLVALTLFKAPLKQEVGIKLGSGPVEEGQVYLIATKECYSLFDFSGLSDREADVADVLDGMATEISASQDASAIGAIFIKVDFDETPVGGEGAGEELLKPPFTEVSGGKEEAKNDEDVEKAGPGRGIGENEAVIESGYTEGDEIAVGRDIEAPGTAASKRRAGFAAGFLKKVLTEIRGVGRGDMAAVGSARKKIILAIVLAVLVLGISVGISLWQKDKTAREAQVSAYLGGAFEKYREATGLVELNRVRAREILIEAQGELKKAQEIDSKNPDAIKLAFDIDSKLKETEISSSVNFEEAINAGEEVRAVVISGKNLIAAGSGGAYQIGSDGEAQEILGDLNGLTGAAVFDNKLYYAGSGGVVRRDLSGGAGQEISDMTGAMDVGVFFGNVYLLKSGQVAKVVPIEGGYANPSDYLESGQAFMESSRMAIDGLIWITNGDKILKFNRGKQEDFEIAGLTGSIGELGPVYTDGNLENLYVIDRVNSVLLVIDKKGNYLKSLQAENLANASDLAVNEAEDTVYVAVGSKVLKTSLK